jgi:L-ascorbate metabolism protein UlaG (beta-lactamase superfamily)
MHHFIAANHTLEMHRNNIYYISTMVISYEGAEFFRIQYGDTVLAFNPVSKASSLKGSKFGADIVLVTLNHKDMNGVETVTFGERKPVVISGPGEYELKGVFVRGVASVSNYDGEKRLNTIYFVSIEGMNLCFLGALGENLPKEVLESAENIDVLFVPIGSEGVLDPESAYKMVVNLEPKIVIPMHFGSSAKKSLDQFLKEGGSSEHEVTDKLTLKKKDLEGKEGEIVVLKSQE